MIEVITQPWPWYVAGFLLGLIVPVLLLIGNKSFGISSSFRHMCAACVPAKIPFLQYNWRDYSWNLFFVAGILAGGFIAGTLLYNPETIKVSESTVNDLAALGITDYTHLLPTQIFSWENLLTLQGLIFMIGGGFLVGFGTRYAGGCTSGHAIMGLSALQWPSLIATIAFMVGGILVTHFVLPILIQL